MQDHKTVILHGDLAARFGGPFSLVVATPAESIKALCSQLAGFQEALFQGEYRIVVRGDDLAKEDLCASFGAAPSVDIVPVIAGAKKKGIGKVILGAVLIAAAFIGAPAVVGALGPTQGLGTTAFTIGGKSVTYANIALFGASTLVGGLVQALTPQPSLGDIAATFEAAAENPGFLFAGPVNAVEEGGPVPIIFGEVLAGSQVVSSGFSAERV